MSQLASSKRSFWPKRLPADESWSIDSIFAFRREVSCPAGRAHCSWGGHFVTRIPLRLGLPLVGWMIIPAFGCGQGFAGVDSWCCEFFGRGLGYLLEGRWLWDLGLWWVDCG